MNIDELFVETNLPEPLSIDELYNCFEKMKQGDMEARDKIINHNIKYVIDLVNEKYSNTPYDLKELVSVGLDCLVGCVDTFDINKELQFEIYLEGSIYLKISDFIGKEREHFNNISLEQGNIIVNESNETKYSDLFEVIIKVIKTLPEKYKNIVMKYYGFIDNKTMTMQEIADELGISQSSVSFIIKISLKNIKSKLEILQKIKTEKYYECDEKQIAEMLSMLSMIKMYDNKTYEMIIKVIEMLPKRDKYIVMKYYGFIDNKTMTMQEIADELGIYIKKVSLIIKRVLKNIKSKLEILQKIKTEIYYEYNEKQIAEMLSMLSIIKIYDNKTYEIIIKVIEMLPKRDKYIVMKYYKFIDNETITLQEIADEFGISKQMISLIIKRVLKNIKNKLDVLKKINKKDYKYNEKQIDEMLSMLSIIKIYDNETYETIINVIKDTNIVMKYYGFIDNKAMTMQEIADELGIYKEKVSKIIHHMLEEISTQLQKQEKQQNQNILIKNKNTNTK